MRNPLDSLASNRAFGTAGSLLGGLIDQLPPGSFDDAVLVGLGGVAVTLPVREPLHHFWNARSARLPLSLSPLTFSL